MPTRVFPTWTDSVPAARGFVVDALASVPPGICQTAALLVSELATNAVRHSGAGEFTVRMEHDVATGRLWIGVTDRGVGHAELRSPKATEEHGRGLRLVSLLADRWGAQRRRATQEKTIWFELLGATSTAAPPAAPAAATP